MVKQSKSKDDDNSKKTEKKTRRNHEINKLPAVLRKVTQYASNSNCYVGIVFVPNENNDISKTFSYYSTSVDNFYNALTKHERLTVVDDKDYGYANEIKNKHTIDKCLPDVDFIDGNMVLNYAQGDREPKKVLKK